MIPSKAFRVLLLLIGFCLSGPVWGGIVTEGDLPISQSLSSFEDLGGESPSDPSFVDGRGDMTMSCIVIDMSRVFSTAAGSYSTCSVDVFSIRLAHCKSVCLSFTLPIELLKIPIHG